MEHWISGAVMAIIALVASMHSKWVEYRNKRLVLTHSKRLQKQGQEIQVLRTELTHCRDGHNEVKGQLKTCEDKHGVHDKRTESLERELGDLREMVEKLLPTDKADTVKVVPKP